MGKLYGYARVSTGSQKLDMQIDCLLKQGVLLDDIYSDEGFSGAKASRPAFDKLLAVVEEGDTIVAYRLDRIGRSVLNLSELANSLKSRGVFIRTISDGIDTSTKMGSLLYNLLSTLADFEREVILERVEAGLALARANGVPFGRRKLLGPEHVADARLKLKAMRVADVADFYKVSERTLFRALKRYPDMANS